MEGEIKRIGAFIPPMTDEQMQKRFKLTMPSATLFGNDWKALKDQRCPLCARKLVKILKSGAYICKSVQHKKQFFISAVKYAEVMRELK